MALALKADHFPNGSCVTSIAGPHARGATSPEMKEGPSGSAMGVNHGNHFRADGLRGVADLIAPFTGVDRVRMSEIGCSFAATTSIIPGRAASTTYRINRWISSE